MKWIQAINKIRHKYYEKIKQSGKEGIVKESLHKEVVHLFRKPWRREMKYCAYLSPFISILLFTKMKHECELNSHKNLLTIILEIHSSSNPKSEVLLLLSEILLKLQGLPFLCWGVPTCLWFLKEPSKPEQFLHLIISPLKSRFIWTSPNGLWRFSVLSHGTSNLSNRSWIPWGLILNLSEVKTLDEIFPSIPILYVCVCAKRQYCYRTYIDNHYRSIQSWYEIMLIKYVFFHGFP